MSDDTRILRRFSGYEDEILFVPAEQAKGAAHRGLVLDVETTGLDIETDEIIELALVQFEYDDAGQILWCGKGQSWFNEPEKEISEHITELTGITAEMVKGHSLPHEIDIAISDASLIVAHHASFDRQMVERYFPAAHNTAWACSMDEIDWKGLGAPSQSLQAVAWWHGFFFDGHRADIDCEAVVKVLAEKPMLAGEPLFSSLMESSQKRTTRIFATGAPFNKKDELKARGYKWHDGSFGHTKSWYIDIEEGPASVSEVEWLKNNILRYPPDVLTFGAEMRYSKRSFGAK